MGLKRCLPFSDLRSLQAQEARQSQVMLKSNFDYSDSVMALLSNSKNPSQSKKCPLMHESGAGAPATAALDAALFEERDMGQAKCAFLRLLSVKHDALETSQALLQPQRASPASLASCAC